MRKFPQQMSLTLEQDAQSDSENQSQENSKAVVVIASIAVVILFGAVIAFLFVRVANKRRS